MQKYNDEQVKAFLINLYKTMVSGTANDESEKRFISEQLSGQALALYLLAVADNNPQMLTHAAQMLESAGYTKAEINRLEKHFRSKEFRHILAQKTSQVRQPSQQTLADSNRQDQENLIHCRQEFSKSSPVSRNALLNIAKTIDSSECHFFVNPSTSIRASWNNNSQWEKLCFAAVQLSNNVNHANAFEHYRWLGYARHEIAVHLKQNIDGTAFGHLRQDVLLRYGVACGFASTVSKNPGTKYTDQYDFCDRALKKIENNKVAKNIRQKVVKDLKNQDKKVWVILDPVTKTPLLHIYRANTDTIIIVHSDPIRIETLFDQVIQGLYKQIFSSNDPLQIVRNAGRIFWYLSLSAPFEGGSNAINLTYIFDILQRKNVRIKRIDDQISADFLAIFEQDVDLFVENFAARLLSQQQPQKSFTP